MHVNLEPGKALQTKYQTQLQQLDQTAQKKPTAKKRSLSSPNLAQLSQSQDLLANKSSNVPVQSATVDVSQSNNPMGALIAQKKAPKTQQQRVRRRAPRPWPQGPVSLGQMVQELYARRPTNPQQFSAIMNKMTLEPGAISQQDAVKFCKVAIHCCRNLENGGAKQDAIKMCHKLFQTDTARGMPKLNPQELAVGLIHRIVNPETIDQKGYGLCGPASIAIQMAKDNPKAFADAGVNLAMLGRANLGDMPLRPNKEIVAHDPQGGIAHADWMMLSAISNANGLNKATNSGKLGEWGGSSLATMFKWQKAIGYPTVMSLPVYESKNPLSHKTGMDAAKNVPTGLKTLVRMAAPLMVPTQFHATKPNFVDSMDQPYLPRNNLELAGKLAERKSNVFVVINESAANPRVLDDLESQVAIFKELAIASGNEDDIAKWSRPISEIRGELASQKMDEEAKSNHWALLDSVEIDDQDRVSMTMYSYGKKTTLPPVPLESFLKIYGGFACSDTADVDSLDQFWQSANQAEEMGYKPL